MFFRTNYVNGNYNGLYEEWYDSGQRYKKYNSIDDKLCGQFEEWHINGQLHIKCTYVNDKICGSYESWHADGKQKMKYDTLNNVSERQIISGETQLIFSDQITFFMTYLCDKFIEKIEINNVSKVIITIISYIIQLNDSQ